MSEAGGSQTHGQVLTQQVPVHRLFFQALLCREHSGGTLDSFHCQRLLLLFFSVLGGDVLNAPWIQPGGPIAKRIAAELRSCYDSSSGGFAAESCESYVMQPTLTMTHCALHVLFVIGELRGALSSWLESDRVVDFVTKCCHQTEGDQDDRSGSFSAYPGSLEADVRFSYSAMMCLYLIALYTADADSGMDRRPRASAVLLHAAFGGSKLLESAEAFILRCWVPHEGGFGGVPWSEAHGGMTFCAVSALSLLGYWRRSSSHCVRRRVLRYVVSRVNAGPNPNAEDEEDERAQIERVQTSVGFQGRPNKPDDTCYTFWLGAALRILETEEQRSTSLAEVGDAALGGTMLPASFIEDSSVVEFVLSCVGPKGGFGRDGSDVDPLHSALGLTGMMIRTGNDIDAVLSCSSRVLCREIRD